MLCLFAAFAKAIAVDRDVCLAVEELFFTVGTYLAFEIGNRDGACSHPDPEGLAHAPYVPAPAARTASKG